MKLPATGDAQSALLARVAAESLTRVRRLQASARGNLLGIQSQDDVRRSKVIHGGPKWVPSAQDMAVSALLAFAVICK